MSSSTADRRSVAFLRGINVGGHRATKDQLIRVFVQQGHLAVDTFLASGNVLFHPAGDADPSPDPARLAEGLEAELGFSVPVTVRTAAELDHLAEAAPFGPTAEEASEGKLQMILLFDPVPADRLAAVLEHATTDDQLAFEPGALLWLPAGPMSTSALDLATIGDLVGQHTIRTANTVRRLAARA